MAILKKVWKCDLCEKISEKEMPRYMLTRKVESDKVNTTFVTHLCDGCASKSVSAVLDQLRVEKVRKEREKAAKDNREAAAFLSQPKAELSPKTMKEPTSCYHVAPAEE